MGIDLKITNLALYHGFLSFIRLLLFAEKGIIRFLLLLMTGTQKKKKNKRYAVLVHR
jgi:hypothetical protein